MTLKTDHGSFEIRDLTFADRRKLHRLELDAMLEWVMDFAFKKPAELFADMDDNQIDEILIAAYNKYKAGISKKKS